MEADNAALLQRARTHPESVSMELETDPADAQHIEMNLGLGVFDMRRSASDLSLSRSDEQSSDELETSSSHDSDSSDTSAHSDSASAEREDGSEIRDFLTALSTQRPMRPLPKRARPSIVVLGEDGEANTKQSSSPPST